MSNKSFKYDENSLKLSLGLTSRVKYIYYYITRLKSENLKLKKKQYFLPLQRNSIQSSSFNFRMAFWSVLGNIFKKKCLNDNYYLLFVENWHSLTVGSTTNDVKALGGGGQWF